MAKDTKEKASKKSGFFPSVLSFSRNLEPSDALMQSGLFANTDKNDAWQNIEIHERRNIGTKSHPSAKDVEKAQGNPVFGDDANISHEHDALKLTFTLKVLGDVAKPTSCNKPEFLDLLNEKIAEYASTDGYMTLAKRYAQNIANARFLWRNRVGANAIKVKVSNTENAEQAFEFDAKKYSISEFHQDDEQLNALAALIANSLASNDYLVLKIECYAVVGQGQRVFPSQEMRDKDDETHKSKFLYKVKTDAGECAGMHSEKIGNAIRTIDNWHSTDEVYANKIIAVEPFGAQPNQGLAHRKTDNDLYTLMAKWLKNEQISDNDKHFVVANLIRGGIFGGNES